MERKPIGVTSPHRKTQPTKQTPETKKAINDKIEAMARECERMPFGGYVSVVRCMDARAEGMSEPNINTKALEDAINEVKDERFQKEMREWLAYSAPKEVIDIWSRYVSKMEAKEARKAELREMWMKRHETATFYAWVVVVILVISVSVWCFANVYDIVFRSGCLR